MRNVYSARDSLDANFLKGLLEQEGIQATVQGEALQETWGNLNLTQGSLPTVWVDDADGDRAMEIVQEYKNRDAANADAPLEGTATAALGSWVCSNCGKRNEAQFDRCWHCTHARQETTHLA